MSDLIPRDGKFTSVTLLCQYIGLYICYQEEAFPRLKWHFVVNLAVSFKGVEIVYSRFQSLSVFMLKSCCQLLFASGRVGLKMTHKSKHTLPSALSAKVYCGFTIRMDCPVIPTLLGHGRGKHCEIANGCPEY